jgi:serine/threonine protein kinase
LLDFGAARQALNADAPRLRPMYTAGYAAPEQYHSNEQLGPWSDIYAIGATMYTCVAGVHPQPASDREKEDQMVPVKELAGPAISPELLEIIEWCLKIDHLARPQTAFELQKALMKGVMEPRETPEEIQEELIEESFSGRLKKTLNRKIF